MEIYLVERRTHVAFVGDIDTVDNEIVIRIPFANHEMAQTIIEHAVIESGGADLETEI